MPQNKNKENEPQNSRRNFFRKLMLKSIQEAEKVGQSAGQQVGKMFGASQVENPQALPAIPTHAADEKMITLLRPPGALLGQAFIDTCHQCGKCVQACPAQCIQMDIDIPEAQKRGGGRPYIHARKSPCVICDQLDCMTACPSGALVQVASREAIQMGKAIIGRVQCLRNRSAEIGGNPECDICVEQCPIGEKALGFDEFGNLEVKDNCTGCGVCEWVCPTEPAAITIELPRSILPVQPAKIPD